MKVYEFDPGSERGEKKKENKSGVRGAGGRDDLE